MRDDDDLVSGVQTFLGSPVLDTLRALTALERWLGYSGDTWFSCPSCGGRIDVATSGAYRHSGPGHALAGTAFQPLDLMFTAPK